LFRGIPIAVLVQKQMSSGNVFLTAALQDQGRAVVVGEPTSGGVYVREYVEIPGRDIKIVFATGWLQRGDGTTLLSKSSQTAIRKVESDRRMNDKNRELFKQYLKQADNRSVNRKRAASDEFDPKNNAGQGTH
jgi:hypothetical protein